MSLKCMTYFDHRTHKVYRDGSSTSADRGNNSENDTCAAFHRDEGRQKPVQQRMDENEGSNHYYESMESGRGNVHRYDTDFDHYESPKNLMKESRVYENQLSAGNEKDPNQDMENT